jgi:sec-independent protein translocase protein TatA
MGSFSIWHWLIVLAVVLILFGGSSKISTLMGDFAKGIKSFKKNMGEDESMEHGPQGTAPGTAPGAAPSVAPPLVAQQPYQQPAPHYAGPPPAPQYQAPEYQAPEYQAPEYQAPGQAPQPAPVETIHRPG